ncbi:sulfatase-like hydrolase/transferase [Algisphaera agarilytica]|uniref:Choline-sulfatase n=1 Tax=Algisphaera agarilytica TaxID=1385975 RepID=A0A7X0HC83_9BACT|nr:sulfatase-like hydrolase/transferase [Algisphaera agarilytica]MBB6431695.1 choline-sulfatase [Algisphaera agarilytica]
MTKQLVLLLVMLFTSAAARADRPNILFIFADDMAWDAMSCMGSEAQTPHLDALAQRGVLFANSYNMGGWGGAICVASRSMLNTGQRLWQVQPHASAMQKYKRNGETGPLPVDAGTSWSQWLGEAGYHTYFTGKWHVHLYDAEQVFRETGTVRPGMPNQTDAGYNRPQGPDDQNWLPWDPQHEGFWKGGKHWSEITADEAVDYLKHSAQRDEPFFAYVAFNAPHDPRQAPKAYVDHYPPERVTVPESFQPLYPYAEAIGLPQWQRDEKLAPYPRTPYAVQVNRAEYFAIISHMDTQIGRILDELEATGQDEDTLVIFSADHGLSVGHHGLIGKQNMYEHSLKAPLIIAGPDLPVGVRRSERVYIQDIVPTTLDFAGVEVPKQVAFRSLTPLLRNAPYEEYDTIYGAYRNLQRAVIHEDWKLIYYPAVPKYRLFDLAQDPQEMNDLADDPRFAEKLSAMKLLLTQEFETQGDRAMLSKPLK